MAAMEDPGGAEQMQGMLSSMGVMNMVIDLAVGGDAERSYTVVKMPGYGATLRDSGMMPARALTSADVAMIPRDATWASVSTVNFSGTVDMILGALGSVFADEGMGDPVEMLQLVT